MSNQPGLALSVSVADCVPILIADAAERRGGRRSCRLARHLRAVVAAAIETMRRECGTDPGDCDAAIGPSIGPDDYEVGGELVDAFLAAGHAPADVERWFRHVRRQG